MRLRTPLVALGSAALALGLLSRRHHAGRLRHRRPGRAAASRAVLDTYLRDTWKSFAAMVDPGTGLVSDNVGGDLAGATRAGYTSPTNIGAYLWSTVVAQDTGLISRKESRARISADARHPGHAREARAVGHVLQLVRPGDRRQAARPGPSSTATPVYPFLSSVDNGWLATGLLVVARSDTQLAAKAERDPQPDGLRLLLRRGRRREATGDQPVGGQIRGGFWVDDPPPGCSQLTGTSSRAPTPVYQTCHHYGAFNTEPRMASYLGIAAGQIPAKHYCGPVRTFHNDNCDYSVDRDQAGRRRGRPTTASRSSRARCPTAT